MWNDKDNDIDHCPSQPSLHKGLACSEGQGAWAPSLCTRVMQKTTKHVQAVFSRKLVPRGMKWARSCRENGGMSHSS